MKLLFLLLFPVVLFAQPHRAIDSKNPKILFVSDSVWKAGGLTQYGFLNLLLMNNYPYSYMIIDTPSVRPGQPQFSCIRLENRWNDSLIKNTIRGEWGKSWNNPVSEITEYYYFKMMTPYYQDTAKYNMCFFQLNDATSGGGVEFEFIMNGGNIHIWMVCYPSGIIDASHKVFRHFDNIAVDTSGGASEWLVKFHPSIDTTGSVMVWRNGIPIMLGSGYEVKGANTDGIIKSGVLVASKPEYQKNGGYYFGGMKKYSSRVIYFGEIAYGRYDATYDDFYSSAPVIINPPVYQKIKGIKAYNN